MNRAIAIVVLISSALLPAMSTSDASKVVWSYQFREGLLGTFPKPGENWSTEFIDITRRDKNYIVIVYRMDFKERDEQCHETIRSFPAWRVGNKLRYRDGMFAFWKNSYFSTEPANVGGFSMIWINPRGRDEFMQKDPDWSKQERRRLREAHRREVRRNREWLYYGPVR